MELTIPDVKVALGMRPPNWRQILLAFPSVDEKKGVYFAWDGTIFSPSGVQPPVDVIVHESIHFGQQDGDPAGWWDKYIEDRAFRLEEEVEAYRGQLWYIREVYGRKTARKARQDIAKVLSGPLYRLPLTKAQALNLLT